MHEESAAAATCSQRFLLSSGEGYTKTGSSLSSSDTVTFVRNEAVSVGGALWTAGASTLQVNDVTFESNKAALGGAVYVISTDEKATEFNMCTFGDNQAVDGGAIYYYTGAGVDICTASVFRRNSASESPAHAQSDKTQQPWHVCQHVPIHCRSERMKRTTGYTGSCVSAAIEVGRLLHFIISISNHDESCRELISHRRSILFGYW